MEHKPPSEHSVHLDKALIQSLLDTARSVLTTASVALEQSRESLGDDFVHSVAKCLAASSRLILTGIGKSALVGQKIAATLNSTGTQALFMHAADAMHGDLGMISPGDIILIISQSGESPEIRTLVRVLQKYDYTIIAMTGNASSHLAKAATHVLHTHIDREADPNNLAPTTSTTLQMALGDALAMCLQTARGFGSQDFAKLHPGGSLGKKLHLRVADVLQDSAQPSVSDTDDMDQVIVEITSKRKGATAVLDAKGVVLGIITDGDLRRSLPLLRSHDQVLASQIMTPDPKCVQSDSLAVEALNQMRNLKISQLVVVDSKGKYEGMIHLHQLLDEGLGS